MYEFNPNYRNINTNLMCQLLYTTNQHVNKVGWPVIAVYYYEDMKPLSQYLTEFNEQFTNYENKIKRQSS